MKTQATKPQPTLTADIARFVIAAVFVTMTMAFLLVPYALSFHPGDPPPQAASASSQRAG